ncbi:serine hydrolase [Microbacterium sp. AZCO]|uniref:serine hydrolase domain-containing protein n=1 Tax=Microbacterium sp. AZCO TaxID=3142976 RepID=UPI0031F42B9E
MSRPRPHALAQLVAATAVVALVSAAVAGCGDAPPSPSPIELIQRDADAVLARVTGTESVRAVLVQQHGVPVFAQYFSATPDETWDVRSVTKCVTSTLVGIAIDRGLIPSVDATLGELLPDYSQYLTPDTARIRLRRVLTDTANFADSPEVIAPYVTTDWVAAILEARAARGRGVGSFQMTDQGSHILAAVVAEATGMSPLAFAREALFEPLGIDSTPGWEERVAPGADPGRLSREYARAEVAWPADPQGINLGSALLRLRPSDLIRFGQLFLDGGDWRGETVVSSSWVEAATAPEAETGQYGSMSFGYQWWVDEDRGEFAALGTGGTVVLVNRAKDAVAVIAAEIPLDSLTSGIRVAPALALAQALVDDLP